MKREKIHLPPLPAEKMDDEGARALAASICLLAADDYWYVCDHPKDEVVHDMKNGTTQGLLRTRRKLEEFFNSDFFEVISKIDRELFMNTIKRYKARGERLPLASEFKEDRRRRTYDRRMGRVG